MRTAPRKQKNNCKGITKLSDGKTVGGVGRLTDAAVTKYEHIMVMLFVIIEEILKT